METDYVIPQPWAGLLLALLVKGLAYGAWCLLVDEDGGEPEEEEGACEVPDH